MGKSWATMNLKGGVGKTTLTANLCRAICEIHPLQILIVDTDPQCSLTLIFRTESEVNDIPEHKTFYSLLCEHTNSMRQKINYCAVGLPCNCSGTIDLIPSHVQVIQPMITAMISGLRSPQISRFEDMMENFRSFIETAKQMYDLVVLDTNPSGNIATFLAIKHADCIISPVTSDRFSIRGVSLMRKVFSKEFNWLNTEPYRLVPVLNNIKNDEEAADVRDQLLKGAEHNFDETALTSWVPHSGFLRYSEKNEGFVHDRPPLMMNRNKHANLVTKLKAVAKELGEKTELWA